MYHFYFNLPKNDKNAGEVILPQKNSVGLPMIISCYACDPNPYAKFAENDFMEIVVKKHNLGFVKMKIDMKIDPDESDLNRWAKNLMDMVQWLKLKHFTNGNKVGIFACGNGAAAALELAKEYVTAFSILTVDDNFNKKVNVGLNETEIPVLFLQGTTDKVTIQTKKFKVDNIIREEDPGMKSAKFIFDGADYYLLSNIEQVAEETAKWLKNIGIN